MNLVYPKTFQSGDVIMREAPTIKVTWSFNHMILWFWFFLIRFVGLERKHLSRHQLLVFFLCLFEKQNALHLLVSPSSSPRLFWNIGEFGTKKCFVDYQTATIIQLFAAIKGNFWTSHSKGNFPKDYFKDVATYLFPYH